jgi:mevalonate kinase
MSKNLDDKKIVAEIERVYEEYSDKMSKLRDRQNELIKEYILKLEEKKKEDLAKKIC